MAGNSTYIPLPINTCADILTCTSIIISPDVFFGKGDYAPLKEEKYNRQYCFNVDTILGQNNGLR